VPGAAVAREIDRVTETLAETVAEIREEIAPHEQVRLSEETKEAVEALKLQREAATSLGDNDGKSTESERDVPPATTHIEKLSILGPSRSDKLKILRNDSERIYRKLHLLRPESWDDFIATIHWFSQQGSPKDLDLVYKARLHPRYSSAETLEELNRAEQLIIKRTELPGFFNFSPYEVAKVNEATIAKSNAVTSPYLRKVLTAERPTQVISVLDRIKSFLQNRFEPPRILRWLSTPLEIFENKSPRDALLEGKTFQVLHLLERMDEDPHY